VAVAEAYLHAKSHLDPSNRFGTYTDVTERQDRQTARALIQSLV